MNKEKLTWCIRQNKGIRLIDLKPHLSKSYMNEADETLENVHPAKGKWKLITAYYACYSALYSIVLNDLNSEKIDFIRESVKKLI